MPLLDAKTIMQLPRRLDDVRRLLQAVDWEGLRRELGAEVRSRLVIVGPVNAGKSTLFNLLTGASRSEVSPAPGTTKFPIEETLGPLLLVDTPGAGEPGDAARWAATWWQVQDASAVLLLLDAAAGLRQSDAALWREIVRLGKPAVVALNKADLLKGADLHKAVAYVEQLLGVEVIPISAEHGTNVTEQLLPAMLRLETAVAVALGRALPAYRRAAAEHVVREAAGLAGAAGAEPLPLLDIPLVLTVQVRMVLRIAAIYGEPFNAGRARELIGTVMGGLVVRTLARQAARLVPVVGWAAAGGVAAAGTYALGRTVIEYFARGKQLDPHHIRDLYRRFARQPLPTDGAAHSAATDAVLLEESADPFREELERG